MTKLRIATALADLLWPPKCAACSVRLFKVETIKPSQAFCTTCIETLLFVTSPICPRCGLPFDGAGPDHLCSSCIKDPPAFQQAQAPLLYGGAMAKALQNFKYRPAPHLARPLGQLLTVIPFNPIFPDLIVPVPLHPRRLRARGFNQSALLARHIAVKLKAPLKSSLLLRIRDTQSQAGLDRIERLANVKDAFVIQQPEKVEGRRVLLVDDVITTAATVREAALTLSRAGARTVHVKALARAL